MKCPICENGKMSKKTVDVSRHGIFVGHFTADVCSNCKEEIFDSAEAKMIEAKMKELGIFGSEKATLYKIGGNIAISLNAAVVKSLGITKASKPTMITQVNEKRLIVEFG